MSGHPRCRWWCRLLELRFGHEVNRTGLQAARIVASIRSGDTLTGDRW